VSEIAAMTSTAELTSPSSANTTLTNSVLDQDYTLEDKFTRSQGRIYLSGVQALVRLPLMQRLRDQAAGLNTGGFISGYRGSLLGGFDLELWRAKKHLQAAGVKFTPGLNEDLGATMVWGTQQTNLFEGATVDGVFSMWYGKGPGVDRCGDVLKHGNAAGTSRLGGVLALAADDHACRSSTLPHGSEGEFTIRDDADPQSGRGAGHPQPGPARLGDVAFHWPLGRLQDDRRNGGIVHVGGRGSVRAADRDA
jgi:indolepyruvate ferredoxin oxidoreductase